MAAAARGERTPGTEHCGLPASGEEGLVRVYRRNAFIILAINAWLSIVF